MNDQLQSWHGTPYRYGGVTRRGVDCSLGICGCDDARSFHLQLPRETKQQASIGTQIDKEQVVGVTWSFSKRGPDKMVCM
ncbi:NlpC/P60 family protein [Escherichia coli]